MVTFGVIGTGTWGTKVIHAIRGLGFDVIPCNRSGEFEGVRCMKDYKALIWGADIIWIATHPPLSCAIAEESMGARKPTVVEKPVAFNSGDVRRLVQLSKSKQVPLIVDYIHLFCARLYLPENLKTLRLNVGGDGPHREYSALWDYGSHALAIALEHVKAPLIDLGITKSDGNFRICLNFKNDVAVNILTGNKFLERTGNFESHQFKWDGSQWNYKLQTLISTIARLHLRGEYFTNGDLAVEVTDLLERLHKMLPADK